jgi:hypothetical protein
MTIVSLFDCLFTFLPFSLSLSTLHHYCSINLLYIISPRGGTVSPLFIQWAMTVLTLTGCLFTMLPLSLSLSSFPSSVFFFLRHQPSPLKIPGFLFQTGHLPLSRQLRVVLIHYLFTFLTHTHTLSLSLSLPSWDLPLPWLKQIRPKTPYWIFFFRLSLHLGLTLFRNQRTKSLPYWQTQSS